MRVLYVFVACLASTIAADVPTARLETDINKILECSKDYIPMELSVEKLQLDLSSFKIPAIVGYLNLSDVSIIGLNTIEWEASSKGIGSINVKGEYIKLKNIRIKASVSIDGILSGKILSGTEKIILNIVDFGIKDFELTMGLGTTVTIKKINVAVPDFNYDDLGNLVIGRETFKEFIKDKKQDILVLIDYVLEYAVKNLNFPLKININNPLYNTIKKVCVLGAKPINE